MTTWQTLALAITVFATAGIARLTGYISRRTFAALWGFALALNTARHTSQERYGWATTSAICVLLMAWIWWNERPPHAAPMAPALRYGHTATLTAAATLTGAAWLATHQHWLFAAALTYTTILFTWIATREYALHRRTIAEHDWARRRALGHNPPSLTPCCSLSRASNGTAHNHKCTDTTRWNNHPETTP